MENKSLTQKTTLKHEDFMKPLNELEQSNGQQHTISEDDRILEIIKEAKVTLDEPLQRPTPILAQVNENKSLSFLTQGDISLLIGKPKARKSFLILMLIEAALSKEVVNGMKGSLGKGKNQVLYIDTEQKRHDVRYNLERFKKSQVDTSLIDIYRLRKYHPRERLKVVEKLIKSTPNLGFVVIDGIRDLVTSINDEEQATEIASKLMLWSEEHQIHIMSVLHQNKGDQFARGHLGTEMVNKSETVLSVVKPEKNKDITIVTPSFMRSKEIQEFSFRVDDNDNPAVIENHTPSNKSPVSEHIERKVIWDVLNETELGYKDLIKKTKETLAKSYEIKTGDNTTKDFIKRMKNKRLIIQNEDKKYTVNNEADYTV